MKSYSLIATAALLLSTLITGPAQALSHPYEFHADARMHHRNFGPVEDAYGYLHLVTDDDGRGVISVMFSNASQLDVALFNARVKFVSDTGRVIGEENFDCWIDAAGFREPAECKVTKPLSLNGFASIEVDFYLTDVPELSAAAIVY